jgi:hypothetical protein
VTNPKKRAKISQLLDHPWLSNSITFLDPIDDQIKSFRPKEEDQLDCAVLDIMEQMGLERKTTIQSVLTGKFNQPAGLYYLLTHHKQFGMGGGEDSFRLSSLSLQNITKDAETGPSLGKDISEELAAVLFQVERTRAPAAAPSKEPGAHNKSPNRFHIKVKAVTRPNSGNESQVVPLPPIAGAEGSSFKTIHATVNIAQLKNNAGLDQSAKEYLKRDDLTTKYGLTKHNGAEKRIHIDESLYQEEKGEKEKGDPRTIKFAFNCVCHTQLQPKTFFERLYTILDKNDVQWYNDEYLCECEWGDIKFELEICKLPRQAACGIRMKRISGDIWEFKKLSSKISSDLDGVSAA